MTEGAGKPRPSAVDRSINHELRAKLVRDLWHRGEAASAQQLHAVYPRTTLGTLTYHLNILERDGIVELAREEMTEGGGIERFVVIAGPNAGEAIRRLRLA